MDYDCTVKYIICNFQNLKEKENMDEGFDKKPIHDINICFVCVCQRPSACY